VAARGRQAAAPPWATTGPTARRWYHHPAAALVPVRGRPLARPGVGALLAAPCPVATPAAGGALLAAPCLLAAPWLLAAAHGALPCRADPFGTCS